ncbi:tetratricopeptide repeat protein [Lentisphaera profundi]|uniref:Tetratricopeptide repeat protein n=1 Tax=Lentisphaera profundi TaxID=1658616 RepID=A0ABY7VTE6_9BACT|nr:tetratricopeptide repeat protein [Lentisphaera profundi]WDE96584.1 tetratricopeptide repeat protein [Lentisphaera profundi]
MNKALLTLLLVGLNIFAQNDLSQQWSFAEGLYKRGFYQDAAEEYQGLLTGGGTQIEKNALLRLIDCYEQTNQNPEEYINLYIDFETDINSRIVVQLKKAALLVQAKKHDEAEELYKEMLKLESIHHEHILYEYGRLLLELGKNQDAITIFTALSGKGKAEEKEVRIYAHYALASLCLEQQLYTTAEKHLLALTEMEKAHPLKSQAYILLIKLLATQERDAELIKAYTTLKNTDPNTPEINDLAIQYVLALIRAKKYDQARGELSLISNPTAEQKPWINYAFGICYYQLGFYKQAIKFFEQCSVLAQFDEAPKAFAYLIYSHIQLKDLTKALEQSKLFDASHPKSSLSAEIHYKNSLLALEKNTALLAIEELNIALKVYLPTWPNTHAAHQLLAQTLAREKRFNESAAIWLKLSRLSQDEKKNTAAFQAVENYLLAKNYDKAEEVLVRIQATDTQKFKKTSLEIEVNISKQKWDKAHKLILIALNQFPENENQGLLYMLQGRCFYLTKQLNEASSSLEKASSLILTPALLAQNLSLLAATYQIQEKNAKAAEVYKVIFTQKLNQELNWSQLQIQTISRLLELENHLDSSLIACESLMAKGNFYSLQKARVLLRKGNYTSSKENLSNIDTDKLDAKELCAYNSIEALIWIKEDKLDKANRTIETIKNIDQWHSGDLPRYLYTKAYYKFLKGQYEQCWKSSSRAYILFNDYQYSSQSLFLAIQSAVKLKRMDDAVKLTKELKKRFPVHSKKTNVANFISKNLTN